MSSVECQGQDPYSHSPLRRDSARKGVRGAWGRGGGGDVVQHI